MNHPWLILISIIGLVLLAGIVNIIYWWRKYTKKVDERLCYYGSLIKSCPKEQLAIVFQEVIELTETLCMTKRQFTEAHCFLAYLKGRSDEAKVPGQQIVLL